MNSLLSQKLEAAVVALAGHGTLKDRLCTAFSEHLEDIEEQELPEEVQTEFGDMAAAMHRARALPGDNVVRASVRKLSNEEAQRFARLVVRTYGLRVHNLAAGAKAPSRMGALNRQQTPLAALLAMEGGGTRAQQDSPPYLALQR
jgi:hypothetical protein